MNYGQWFAVTSDYYGAGSATLAVSQFIKSRNPEFIISAGDNYSTYYGTIDTQVGQFYHEFIFPYAGSYGPGDTVNRFFPAVGNHDIDGGGIINYLSYFELPDTARYYDFVKGNVHFFALNSNISEPEGTSDTSVQAQWLQSKLAGSASLYNIVYFHHPPFSSGLHGSNTYMQWPFKQWGATAVLSGHDHYYEHLNIDNLDYFICGTGGQPLYTTYNAIPGSIRHYSGIHGALFTKANHDSITFQFINISDSLIDQYSIYPISIVKNDLVKNESEIFQNSPNPFSSVTKIKLFLAHSGNVQVKVFNILGDEVETLSEGRMTAGFHEINWNAINLKNGMYFYRFRFDDIFKIRKAIVNNEF